MTDYKKHIVAMPSILEGYTVPEIENGEMTFDLIEDGEFSLDRFEFANAFNVLFSEEFAEFCNAINKRERSREGAYKHSDRALNELENNSLDTSGFYMAINAYKNYGYNEGLVLEKRETIIENVGWLVWYDACRLYEHFTGVPREWLS